MLGRVYRPKHRGIVGFPGYVAEGRFDVNHLVPYTVRVTC